MKLLYLTTHALKSPILAFTAELAELTDSSVTLLVGTKDVKGVEKIEANIKKVAEALINNPYEIKVEVGDPFRLVCEELEAEEYDLVIMGVRPRRRMVPSGFRHLSQKIINISPIPVLLVREENLKLEKILICTGGQSISEPVVKFSAKLAREADLQATLLYVTSAVPSMYTGMDEVEETLVEVLATDTPLAKHLRISAGILAGNNVKAEIEICHGDVVESILNEAQEGEYDLVVLGASESNTLAGILLGNVTQQIINRAGSAVLIVKS
jgi:nucleotide-binding universal stress UspA family protein